MANNYTIEIDGDVISLFDWVGIGTEDDLYGGMQHLHGAGWTDYDYRILLF